jgi:hypothetical protein
VARLGNVMGRVGYGTDSEPGTVNVFETGVSLA